MIRIIDSAQYTDANDYPSGTVTRIRGGGGDTTQNLYSTDHQIVFTLGYRTTRILQIAIIYKASGTLVVSRSKIDTTWSAWA